MSYIRCNLTDKLDTPFIRLILQICTKIIRISRIGNNSLVATVSSLIIYPEDQPSRGTIRETIKTNDEGKPNKPLREQTKHPSEKDSTQCSICCTDAILNYLRFTAQETRMKCKYISNLLRRSKTAAQPKAPSPESISSTSTPVEPLSVASSRSTSDLSLIHISEPTRPY